MNKVGRCILTALLGVCSLAGATINIGVFNSSQMIAVGPGGETNPLNASDSTANNAPAGLGGQREFIARRTSGGGRIQLDIDYTAVDALSFTSSGDAVGRGLIIWDGPDTTVSEFNPLSATPSIARGEPNTFGLTGSGLTGGVDLTSAGTNNALTIEADADNVGLPVIFHFYRSAGVFATATLQVPGDAAFEMRKHVIYFSNFTAVGAPVLDIFADVKAITMQIDGRNASDATFDNLQATYAPEPRSAVLAGTAVAAVGLLRLARRNR